VKQPAVYIITNKPHGAVYVGVTSDLIKRIYQHKEKEIEGFSKRYNLDKLVYYEQHETMDAAILYEKKLKNRNRRWKIARIEEQNPKWDDLYETIL